MNIKIKRFLNVISFLLIILFFSSCQQDRSHITNLNDWMNNNGKIKILATTEMIADIVKEIGKDRINCWTMIQKDQDPHSYELVKGDHELLEKADIIFYNGLGLEHKKGLVSYFLDNFKAIALGDEIYNHYNDQIITSDQQIDPHIWMDISLWAKIIDPIVECLIKLDPKGKEEYFQNGCILKEKLLNKDREILSLIHQIPENKRYLVTSHNAFGYFVRRYLVNEKDDWEKRISAPEGYAPNSQISSIDIQRVLDFLKEHDVHIMFFESNVSKDVIHKIFDAGKKNDKYLHIANQELYGDAMGEKNQSYIDMMHYNAMIIYQSFLEQYE